MAWIELTPQLIWCHNRADHHLKRYMLHILLSLFDIQTTAMATKEIFAYYVSLL
jgi:hypothetical protein